MKKLFVYACSHGKYGNTSDEKWTDKHSWPEIVAKELNLDLINRSAPGAHNYKIFQSFLKDYQQNLIEDNDIVVVQWSHYTRAWLNGSNNTLMVHVDVNTKHTRMYYKYFFNDHQEIHKMLGYTLIMKNLVNNLFFDFSDGREQLKEHAPEIEELINGMDSYLNAHIHSIAESTPDLLFPCHHMNQKGHRQLAYKFIESMKNKI